MVESNTLTENKVKCWRQHAWDISVEIPKWMSKRIHYMHTDTVFLAVTPMLCFPHCQHTLCHAYSVCVAVACLVVSHVCCCCCCVLLCSLGIYAFGVLCFSVHFVLAMLCALCIFSMAVFNVMVVYFVCWVSVRLCYMTKLSVASAIAMVMPTLKLNSKLKPKPKAKEAKVLMRDEEQVLKRHRYIQSEAEAHGWSISSNSNNSCSS